jgi:hypothetical protein
MKMVESFYSSLVSPIPYKTGRLAVSHCPFFQSGAFLGLRALLAEVRGSRTHPHQFVSKAGSNQTGEGFNIIVLMVRPGGKFLRSLQKKPPS